MCLLPVSLLLVWSTIFGQQPHENDSLLNVVQTASHDSTRIEALCRLSRAEPDIAKSYGYLNTALTIAYKSKWRSGVAFCYRELGNFYIRSDYAKALEYYLKSLRASEDLQDTENIAQSLFGIGNVYRIQENPTKALPYLLQAEELFRLNHAPELTNTYNLLGIAYEKLGKTDSALYYFNRGYEMMGEENPIYASRILRGLGNVHAAKGDVDLALSFYQKSVARAIAAEHTGERSQSYLQLSKLFSKTGQHDSALFYGRKAMQLAQDRKAKPLIIWSANQLAEIYETLDTKKALRYYKLSAAVKDSIFGAESQAQVQNLTFSELERQRELQEAKRKEAEERKHNLQYAAIALGIVSLTILFFVLSYSIIANPKFIRFFGVVALLIFFEFLNLLLHPYLEELTHHSPVLMLLIMVCVAALLVPLHHRLEHWLTHRMIEKNNRIRLRAAKKTIEQLEEKKGNLEKSPINTDA